MNVEKCHTDTICINYGQLFGGCENNWRRKNAIRTQV